MPHLRQSAADWCFFKPGTDPAAYYRQLAAIGFAGVEMVAPQRIPFARAAGLSIVNMDSPGKERGLSDPANHAEVVPGIRAAIDAAKANAIAQVIAFSGNRAGPDDAAGLRHVVAGLKQVALYAEKAGVTLTFEMFNTFDHPGYLADSSRFGFDAVRQVGSPAVKVLFDIYHMHRMGENVLESLLGNLELVRHIHVAASPKRDCPRAGGAIDYAKIVRAVHGAGYRGYWGQEFLPGAEGMEELAGVAREMEEWGNGAH